jgi:hypothetical protein
METDMKSSFLEEHPVLLPNLRNQNWKIVTETEIKGSYKTF